MRRAFGLLVVLVVLTVQLGFAHATVCRSLMGREAVPAESHCASMKTKTDPGCGGMAGCKDLCKRENPASPQASGKTGIDTGIHAQADTLAVQAPVAREASNPVGGSCWRMLEWTALRGGHAPHAFLLNNAFLI